MKAERWFFSGGTESRASPSNVRDHGIGGGIHDGAAADVSGVGSNVEGSFPGSTGDGGAGGSEADFEGFFGEREIAGDFREGGGILRQDIDFSHPDGTDPGAGAHE